MKKADQVKTFELLMFMIFAAICFYRIVVISDIYQRVATDKDTMILCIFLWLSLFLSFAFIFIDFSMYSKQHQSLADLSNAAKQDSVARIANRYSIDSIIDEYADKDVPIGMGVAMIELTSLKDVNANFGRMEGNNLIRGFSIILSMASLDECIVGRNGGNRFIILYEEGADLHLEVFLDRLSDKVRDYNANAKNHLMKYEYGTAYAESDGITSITKLIAESSMRLSQKLAAKEENELRKKLEAMNLTPQPAVAVFKEDAPEPDCPKTSRTQSPIPTSAENPPFSIVDAPTSTLSSDEFSSGIGNRILRTKFLDSLAQPEETSDVEETVPVSNDIEVSEHIENAEIVDIVEPTENAEIVDIVEPTENAEIVDIAEYEDTTDITTTLEIEEIEENEEITGTIETTETFEPAKLEDSKESMASFTGSDYSDTDYRYNDWDYSDTDYKYNDWDYSDTNYKYSETDLLNA